MENKQNLSKLILRLLSQQEAIAQYLSEKDPEFTDKYLKHNFDILYREANSALEDND